MMSKKGAITVLVALFSVLAFLVIWVNFGAEQITFWGEQYIITYDVQGLEALFYLHINAVVGFGLLIFILVVAVIG